MKKIKLDWCTGANKIKYISLFRARVRNKQDVFLMLTNGKFNRSIGKVTSIITNYEQNPRVRLEFDNIGRKMYKNLYWSGLVYCEGYKGKATLADCDYTAEIEKAKNTTFFDMRQNKIKKGDIVVYINHGADHKISLNYGVVKGLHVKVTHSTYGKAKIHANMHIKSMSSKVERINILSDPSKILKITGSDLSQDAIMSKLE